MRTTMISGTMLAVLAVTPAAAHPGHGLAGWLHHGEGLGVALVLGAVLGTGLWRVVAARSHRGAR